MPTSALRAREVSRVPLVAMLLVATVALLLAFTYATMATQHATGIYAQAHSRWVRAHVRSVGFLNRYVRTADPGVYDSFRGAMRIPRSYESARVLLESGRPDREAAVQAFVDGGLARADAERAATFAPILRRIEPTRRAVDAWVAGDAQFDTLAAIGEELRAAQLRGDTAAMRAMLPRVDAVDRELVRLEDQFAAGLADAARMLPPLLLAVGALLGFVLVTIGTVTVHRIALAADQSHVAQREHFVRLRALMEGLPDVISWYDRDHRITYANPALEKLTGVPRERAVGMEHRELAKHTGASAEVVNQWEDALARTFAGERDVAMLINVPARDARMHWFQVRFVPQGDDRTVETVLAIGRDVTAIRESEATLRERDAQLQHAQKLEAVGRLAGGVAHEFNNILTAITANLELALVSMPEGAEARQDLHAALTAARRASGLTRQLLVFARPDQVERRLVDVARIVAELEVMLRRLAGEQVQVVIGQHADVADALADPGQLQQILLNLVSNARDAMPQGGVVHLDVDHVNAAGLRDRGALLSPTPDEAIRQGEPENGWVTLTVRDTGSGMSAETIARLFEPFFTTKAPGVGTGLGLPVVRGIVTRLGGRIHLDTAVGAGTAITIALPAADPAAMQAGRAASTMMSTGETRIPSVDRHAVRREGTVLLVEDEAPVRIAARRMLESVGYTVLEAKHGEDALIQWEQAPVSVVVTDFMMPGMNGVELLARLREQRPELPAVIVSGYTGGDTIDEAALGGRTALLQKPFARMDLLDRVDELLSAEPA